MMRRNRRPRKKKQDDVKDDHGNHYGDKVDGCNKRSNSNDDNEDVKVVNISDSDNINDKTAATTVIATKQLQQQ